MTTLIVKDVDVDWRRARKTQENMKEAVRNIVTEGAYQLLEAANETVPDDPATGGDDLKASGFVEVDQDGNVVVAYSSPYALRQHEIPYKHQGKGRWKWLEMTAKERAAEVGDKMARTAKNELEGKL
jgi:hypothetical protein